METIRERLPREEKVIVKDIKPISVSEIKCKDSDFILSRNITNETSELFDSILK